MKKIKNFGLQGIIEFELKNSHTECVACERFTFLLIEVTEMISSILTHGCVIALHFWFPVP